MDKQVSFILDLIDQAFDRKAWHGTNLKGSLRRMTAAEASWRPAAARHNAWEIAVHCAYWKYAVWRRLTGVKRGSFPMKGSNWIERPAAGADWKADFALLDQMHRQLRDTIAALKAVPDARMLTGIAAHDLYHAGQIQLLKRLRQSG